MGNCIPCTWYYKRRELINERERDASITQYKELIKDIDVKIEEENEDARDHFQAMTLHHQRNDGQDIIYAMRYADNLKGMRELQIERTKTCSRLATVGRTSRLDSRKKADRRATKYIGVVFENEDEDDEVQQVLTDADDKHRDMINGVINDPATKTNEMFARSLLSRLDTGFISPELLPPMPKTNGIASIASITSIGQHQHSGMAIQATTTNVPSIEHKTAVPRIEHKTTTTIPRIDHLMDKSVSKQKRNKRPRLIDPPRLTKIDQPFTSFTQTSSSSSLPMIELISDSEKDNVENRENSESNESDKDKDNHKIDILQSDNPKYILQSDNPKSHKVASSFGHLHHYNLNDDAVPEKTMLVPFNPKNRKTNLVTDKSKRQGASISGKHIP